MSGIYTFHGSYLNPFDIIGQIAKQIRVPYLTCIFEYRSYYRYIYLKCLFVLLRQLHSAIGAYVVAAKILVLYVLTFNYRFYLCYIILLIVFVCFT